MQRDRLREAELAILNWAENEYSVPDGVTSYTSIYQLVRNLKNERMVAVAARLNQEPAKPTLVKKEKAA